MPEHDRDRSVEHVIRQVLPGSASTQSSCVDGETVAAWTTGSLRSDEAAHVEHHVAECARCQAMMAAFVRTVPATSPPESIWNRWRIGWLVPLATAATATALWIASPERPAAPGQSAGANSSVALAPKSPPETLAPSSAPAVPEQSAPRPSQVQESVDLRAGNEVAKRLNREAMRDGLEERFAAAPSAADAQSNGGRRELAPADARSLQVRAAAPPFEIAAPGGAVRWRIVNEREVERSTTGGSEWAPATIDAPDVLTAGAAASPSVCWIVGRRGAVYVTNDGVRFERLPFPETADLTTITAVDERAATVSTADGRSWRTVDRGGTWSAVR